MVKVDVLDELFGVREGLESRIIELHPSSPDEFAQVSRLMSRRDHVTGLINAVIAATFASIPTTEVLQSVQALENRAAGLAALANTFDRINEVLSTVDDVIGVAAKIVKLAA